ncbi:MAG: hypothetical protein C4538_03985 [Nitrospiraceae bacterium]|nr:MAG: hypothetical protein C4538_03985 [Nitrospiraceae bacterium]
MVQEGGGHDMKKIILICVLISGLLVPFVFAEEKVVDEIVVDFGIISWEDIEAGIKERPSTHTEEYHHKMAKAMSEMHGGGGKGEYHVMIMLKEKASGKPIKNENVWVTAVSQAAPETITHKLKPITMDEYYGYGEFFKLNFPGLYVFQVKIDLTSMVPSGAITRRTEFERKIPSR